MTKREITLKDLFCKEPTYLMPGGGVGRYLGWSCLLFCT
jgi:hypothetical protein